MNKKVTKQLLEQLIKETMIEDPQASDGEFEEIAELAAAALQHSIIAMRDQADSNPYLNILSKKLGRSNSDLGATLEMTFNTWKAREVNAGSQNSVFLFKLGSAVYEE
jgi:hypothetical protein